MKNEEQVLDDVDLEDFEAVEEDEGFVGPENAPEFASPEWSDYVMGLLTDDEKVNNSPRTEGLVRIARMLFQNLQFPRLQVHHVSPDYAAVTCSVICNGCEYMGSAEVHPQNTDSPYNKYPLATAETRALGRAVKRLLCLNVLTAEETSKVADLTIPKSDENRTEGSITSTQIKLIERQCKSLDYNVVDVIKKTVGDHGSVDEISHAEGLQILKLLDEWKRNSPEDSEVEGIGKFSEDWKSNFKVEVVNG